MEIQDRVGIDLAEIGASLQADAASKPMQKYVLEVATKTG